MLSGLESVGLEQASEFVLQERVYGAEGFEEGLASDLA
jgi:hypothetical protein